MCSVAFACYCFLNYSQWHNYMRIASEFSMITIYRLSFFAVLFRNHWRLKKIILFKKNSRYLLNAWSLGFLIEFLTHVVLFGINISLEEQPQRKHDPRNCIREWVLNELISAVRVELHSFSLTTQTFIALNEILIASERIVSSLQPARYYQSGLAIKTLFCFTIIILIIMICQVYLSEGVCNNQFRVEKC